MVVCGCRLVVLVIGMVLVGVVVGRLVVLGCGLLLLCFCDWVCVVLYRCLVVLVC